MYNAEVAQKVLAVKGAVNITLLSKRSGKSTTFRIRRNPTTGVYNTYQIASDQDPKPEFLGAWSVNHHQVLVWRRGGIKPSSMKLGKWLHKYIQHPGLYDATVQCTRLWRNLL